MAKVIIKNNVYRVCGGNRRKKMPRNLDQWFFFNNIRIKSLSHQKHLRPSPSIQTANLISCQQFMLMLMRLCSSINHARLLSISKSIIFICFFSVLVSLSFIKGSLHNSIYICIYTQHVTLSYEKHICDTVLLTLWNFQWIFQKV